MSPGWIREASYYDASLSATTPICILVFSGENPAPPAAHFHAGVQVTAVLSGEVEDYYPDAVIKCTRGDAYLCSMWEPHGWRDAAPGTTNVTLIFLPEFLGDEAVADTHWLDLFAVPALLRPRVGRPETRARVAAIGEELLREIENRERGWLSMVRLKTLELLLTLGRSWDADAARLAGDPAPRADGFSRIAPALELIRSGHERRVSVQRAAAACRLSETHFKRVFQQVTGTSFGRFVLQSRVAAAARLLRSSRRSVEAVAWETGFVDGSHLHRAFLKECGCTPGEYRAGKPRLATPGPSVPAAPSSDLPARPTLALWPQVEPRAL
jgi:AraC family L-rhamnose operon transcriptional activator RhaR/AraC family L-rhamnose operon regulatory protein RhaS